MCTGLWILDDSLHRRAHPIYALVVCRRIFFAAYEIVQIASERVDQEIFGDPATDDRGLNDFA
jgi:hypothetical protein